MKIGDLVEVIDEDSHFYHARGAIVDLTRGGDIVVQFKITRTTFEPHQLEVAEPLPEAA